MLTEASLLKVAGGLLSVAAGWIFMNIFTRLNSHSAKLDTHAEEINIMVTAGAVRENMLISLNDKVGKLEAGLYQHFKHEENNMNKLRESVHNIELHIASMPRRDGDS